MNYGDSQTWSNKKYLMPVVCGESLTIYRLHKCVGAHVVKAHCIFKYVFGFKLKSKVILLLVYFYYYLWISLHDLLLFIGFTVSFYSIFIFTYNIFNKKFLISEK